MAVATILILSACGGGGSSSPESSKSSTPAPSPAAQPKGEYGVTYEIQNWDEYAEDPAVLAWKKISEALGAVINIERIPDYLRGRVPAETLANITQNLKNAKGRGFYYQDVAKARIESATRTGDAATLVTCEWLPSISLHQEDGKLYGDDGDSEKWSKYRVTMKLAELGWIITAFKDEGTCPGAPPS